RLTRLTAARLLGHCGRVRDDDQSGAHGSEDAHEIAALELEPVRQRLGELVSLDFGFVKNRSALRCLLCALPHRRPPALLVVFIRSAASLIAWTIRGYVPQRQTLRSITFAMSCSDGVGLVRSRPTTAITMPDVQYPHWNASASTNASCTGWSRSPSASASIVITGLSPTAASRVTHDRAT